eukprot:1128886-Amphidinium_carterae.1
MSAKKKAVFSSSKISVSAKLVLHKIYVVCHLLLNCTVSPTLTHAQLKKMQGIYMKRIWTCVGKISNSSVTHRVIDGDLLSEYKLPALHLTRAGLHTSYDSLQRIVIWFELVQVHTLANTPYGRIFSSPSTASRSPQNVLLTFLWRLVAL